MRPDMRLAETFTQLQQQKRKALIPYITSGDPTLAMTVPLMHTLVESGADILELGFPFSDPVADGPVIQAAHERALKNKESLTNVLRHVAQFRQKDQHTPVVLMGYANPIEIMGYETFVAAASEAGVDGVLVVDMPPEEGHMLFSQLKQSGIAPIFLITPNTTDERIQIICEQALGYLYYVSLKGVTGSGALDVTAVKQRMEYLHSFTKLPIAVGFGIRDAESARALATTADGVIVGSALIERIAANLNDEKNLMKQVQTFMQSLRAGVDGVA